MGDWTGWTSTAAPVEDIEPCRGDLVPPLRCELHGESRVNDRDDADDADATTFCLTSMTSDLDHLKARANTVESSMLEVPFTEKWLEVLGEGGAQMRKKHLEEVIVLDADGSKLHSTWNADGKLELLDEPTPEAFPLTVARGETLAVDAALALQDIADDQRSIDERFERDDFYGGAEDSLAALKRIDEQLQNLVPEREWEAKAIGPRLGLPALTTGDDNLGAIATWTGAASAGLLPTLGAATDSQWRDELLALAPVQQVGRRPEPEEIQRLLMEAVPESRPLSASSARAFPESSSLREAKRMLLRLSTPVVAPAGEVEDDDGEAPRELNEVFDEAALAINDLEDGIKRLEAIAENAPQEPKLESGLAPFAARLEELGREVALVLEREDDSERMLPNPAAPSEDLEEDQLDDDDDIADAWLEPMADHELRPHMELEPPRALDLQLPSGDTVWDDAELERLSQAMNAHFGDVLPDFAKEGLGSATLASDEDAARDLAGDEVEERA